MYLKAYTNPNSLPFTNNPLKTSQEAEQLLKYVNNLNKNPENLISTFKLFDNFYYKNKMYCLKKSEFDKFYFNMKPKMNLDFVKVILTV